MIMETTEFRLMKKREVWDLKLDLKWEEDGR